MQTKEQSIEKAIYLAELFNETYLVWESKTGCYGYGSEEFFDTYIKYINQSKRKIVEVIDPQSNCLSAQN